MDAEELFNSVNIKYEEAYADNATLIDYVRRAIDLLEPGSQVLDLGCGTGVPVASTLVSSGMHVTGIDISQAMLDIVKRQVPEGTYTKASMVDYKPTRIYDGIFFIFSFMQLSFQDFHSSLLKFTSSVRPGGVLLFAAVPADNYVPDQSVLDETFSYAEDVFAPFMGHDIRVTLCKTEGMLKFLRSVGLEILSHETIQFQPTAEGLFPEDEVFILARRTDDHPLMGPYPLPKNRPAKWTLNEQAWPRFAETLVRHDLDAVLQVLKPNKEILDIGSGHGELSISIARHVGKCLTLEPNPTRNDILSESGNAQNVHVLRGTAEHIPLPDRALDAAVAMWILDHVDDLEVSLREMVRVIDPDAPHAKIVVVQGAPDCEIFRLIDRSCVPLLAQSASALPSMGGLEMEKEKVKEAESDHQGYMLHTAARIFKDAGLGNISLAPVDVWCRFPAKDGESLEERSKRAADVLVEFRYAGHELAGKMKEALGRELKKKFADEKCEVGDQGVMLVARPSSHRESRTQRRLTDDNLFCSDG